MDEFGVGVDYEVIRPVDWVVEQFGGVTRLAKAIRVTPGAVSRWWSGNGKLPGGQLVKILSTAERLGLDITSNDLIKGRTRPRRS